MNATHTRCLSVCLPRVSQKQLRKAAWPSLQWSSDEVVAARALDNEIQVRQVQMLDEQQGRQALRSHISSLLEI